MSEPLSRSLRVVRGNPTPDELAALVAVLSARAAAAQSDRPASISAWRDRARLMRSTPPHGPGQWRASAWPR